jgi:hypothetical protein
MIAILDAFLSTFAIEYDFLAIRRNETGATLRDAELAPTSIFYMGYVVIYILTEASTPKPLSPELNMVA